MAAVQFACVVKTGPLHEHSPMLNDISQVHVPNLPASVAGPKVASPTGGHLGEAEQRNDQDVRG
jgi:hypothetical protein